MKKLRYYVNTGGKWIKSSGGSESNFIIFNSATAANRYFMRRPGRQIDVRGIDSKGRCVGCCWKYWMRGKVVEQKLVYVKPVLKINQMR